MAELLKATGDTRTIMTLSLLLQAIIYTPGWPPFYNILLLTYVEFRVYMSPIWFLDFLGKKKITLRSDPFLSVSIYPHVELFILEKV